jgi:hypothetical protein
MEGLIPVIAAAVVVSAIAIVLQMLILLGMYRTQKQLHARVTELLPRARSLMDSAEATLAQGRKQVLEVTAKASEVLDLTKDQLVKVDDSLVDVTNRVKAQMERIELMLDDTLGRIQETVTMVHGGVMKPVREVTGVAAGLRAALNHLVRGNRPNVSQATHDEEMFI